MGSVAKQITGAVKKINPVNAVTNKIGAAGQIAQGKNPLAVTSLIKSQLGVAGDAATQAATPQYGADGVYSNSNLSDMELQAGITPPGYESYRNAAGTGLKDQFKYDPNQSGAFAAQKNRAMSNAPSAWANIQTQQQQLEQQNQMDQAAKQNQQGQSMAAASLARVGGLGGGARTRMAMQGAKDLMLQKQAVGRQGMADRLGIASQDETTRQGLLKSVADTELAGQEKNLGLLTGDVTNKAQFDANRYNQQMQAWGANKSANAQVASANASKGSKK